MTVALELAEQVAERRRDQLQHRPAGPGYERPRGPPPGRAGRLVEPERRQRRIAGARPELSQ